MASGQTAIPGRDFPAAVFLIPFFTLRRRRRRLTSARKLPVELDRIIHKALEKDRGKRFCFPPRRCERSSKNSGSGA